MATLSSKEMYKAMNSFRSEESMKARIRALEADRAELHEYIDDIAVEVLHHIDTMYPKMWDGVAKGARTSIRNTIIRSAARANEDLIVLYEDGRRPYQWRETGQWWPERISSK